MTKMAFCNMPIIVIEIKKMSRRIFTFLDIIMINLPINTDIHV